MSEKIAISFFAHDESLIEYYTRLRTTWLVPYSETVELCSVIETKPYRLDGDALAAEQKPRLMELCRQRLEAFMAHEESRS